LNVVHSDVRLNCRFPQYALANKPYVAAYTEQHATEDILILIDSDSIILNPPLDLALPEQVVAATTPVWDVGIGCTDETDPAFLFWRSSMDACGVLTSPPYVETRVTRRKVWFYVNSGLVVVRRSKGVLADWLRCFETICANRDLMGMLGCRVDAPVSRGPSFFIEQAALSIALASRVSQTKLLDGRYNCPLHYRPLFPAEALERKWDLGDIVQFHYNRVFHTAQWFGTAKAMFDTSTPQFRWLTARLPLEPILPSCDLHRLLRLFNGDMNRWRGHITQTRETRYR
jgi:hypothetical protein